MLSNRWLKYQERTAENCQILYAKFHVLFKNIQRKIPNFVCTLVFSLVALENFICAEPIQKQVFILLSSSIGCSLANRDTKDPIVMTICLMNGKEWSNRPLTKSHQRDPKSIFKCSLGHQNNAQQSFVSTLCCRYVHNISTHNGKYI